MRALTWDSVATPGPILLLLKCLVCPSIACRRALRSCSDLQRPFQSSSLSLGASAAGGQIRRDNIVFCPQPKTTAEGVDIVASATTRRQCVELLYVASPDHRI